MKNELETAPRRILRLPEVLARTGMGRSWVYREIAVGRFPKPTKIGRASGWDSEMIDAYLASVLGPLDAQLPLFPIQQEHGGAGDAS